MRAWACGVGNGGGQALPIGPEDGGAEPFEVGILRVKGDTEKGRGGSGRLVIGGDRLLRLGEKGGGANAALAADRPARRSLRLILVARPSGPGSSTGSSSSSEVSAGGAATASEPSAIGA